MKKIIISIVIIFASYLVLAQHKTMTIYHSGGTTDVVNLSSTDSIIIFICGASKVNYGGKAYNTVLIGNQCWLKENLDIGTMIISSQNSIDNGIIEKYCYNNDPVNCATYGAMYQWNEAMQYIITNGAKGICPNEWHIPSYAELQILKTTVNENSNSLKAVGQGSGAGAGTNASGFSGLLAGSRNYLGGVNGLGYYTLLWSSTEYAGYAGWSLDLQYNDSSIDFFAIDARNGQYIRCIKD
jgi:uncharacterized protein (TIGR02145 family)